MPEQYKEPEAAAGAGLALVRQERPHFPSRLFPLPMFIIVGAAFAVVLPFFFTGIPSGHDFEFHLNSWMEALSQWKQGILYPRWADLAHHGYGEPRFVFYPPASWMLGAVLGALLPWALAPGAYVWLVLTLAGGSMFVLARNWLSRRDAIFAAVLYAANPYHLLIVYWRSAYAELLAGALLPLLFLCVVRLQQEGRKWIALLALVMAAIWLTNAPAAVMANYSVALLLVLIAVVDRSPRILWQGTLGVLLGAGLAAFYILPAAYEQRWVDIFQILSEGVRPRDNYSFTMIDDVRHNQFNRLVSLVALAEMIALALAAWHWRRWRRQLPRAWWVLAAWGAASILLMCSITSPAWDHLPELRYMQLPWRWLLSFNLAFALLIAAAWRRWQARLLTYVALLMVMAFAGYRYQMPWWDHATEIAQMADAIQTAQGYEGTDEYTPADADNYAISRDAPRVAFEGNGTAQIQIERWGPETKSLTATVDAPGRLILRLFNYPAWKAEVNGHPVIADPRDVTGQMMIQVRPGQNRVQVAFGRTWDRKLGGWLSLATGVILGWMVIRGRSGGVPSSENAD